MLETALRMPNMRFPWRKPSRFFFNAPLLVIEDRRHSLQELRLHALGKTDADRRLHITFTLRQSGTLIRVISARDMHRKEKVVYDKAS